MDGDALLDLIGEMEGSFEEEFDFGETVLPSLLDPFLARDVMEWDPLDESHLLPTILRRHGPFFEENHSHLMDQLTPLVRTSIQSCWNPQYPSSCPDLGLAFYVLASKPIETLLSQEIFPKLSHALCLWTHSSSHPPHHWILPWHHHLRSLYPRHHPSRSLYP